MPDPTTLDTTTNSESPNGENQGRTRDAANKPHDPIAPDNTKLLGELAELKSTLTLARSALDAAERRHAIELELLRADAVDIETARLMTQAAVEGKPNTDIAAAVTDLRRRKPFLFRTPTRTAPSAMSGTATTETPTARLAHEARESGDRKTLLRYLRARRG